jgi:hypothetical protein
MRVGLVVWLMLICSERKYCWLVFDLFLVKNIVDWRLIRQTDMEKKKLCEPLLEKRRKKCVRRCVCRLAHFHRKKSLLSHETIALPVIIEGFNKE